MPTLVFFGDGARTKFELPGSYARSVYVGGVLTATSAEAFESITLASAPGNKVPVQIDFELVPQISLGSATGVLRSTATAAFTVPDGVSQVILAGSGTVPVKFPPRPHDGQNLLLNLETAYTAVSVVANTNQSVVAGAAIAVTAGSFASFRFNAAQAKWYRVS